jgi:hypothetical protein
MCSGRKGGSGESGERLVRDQLGVIAQEAATAAPRLLTAAVPRELRMDPCEKKSKREETCVRRRERPTMLPGDCREFL